MSMLRLSTFVRRIVQTGQDHLSSHDLHAPNFSAIKDLQQNKNKPLKPVDISFPALTAELDDAPTFQPPIAPIWSSASPLNILNQKVRAAAGDSAADPIIAVAPMLGEEVPATPPRAKAVVQQAVNKVESTGTQALPIRIGGPVPEAAAPVKASSPVSSYAAFEWFQQSRGEDEGWMEAAGGKHKNRHVKEPKKKEERSSKPAAPRAARKAETITNKPEKTEKRITRAVEDTDKALAKLSPAVPVGAKYAAVVASNLPAPAAVPAPRPLTLAIAPNLPSDDEEDMPSSRMQHLPCAPTLPDSPVLELELAATDSLYESSPYVDYEFSPVPAFSSPYTAMPPMSMAYGMPQQMQMGYFPLSPAGYYPPPAAMAMAGVPPMPMPMPFPLQVPDVVDLVRRQIEYYFSPANLLQDAYLRSVMDEDGFVSLKEIVQFRRVAKLQADAGMILDAVYGSQVLEVVWAEQQEEGSAEEELMGTKLRAKAI